MINLIKKISQYKWHISDYATIGVLACVVITFVLGNEADISYNWRWSTSLGYLFYQDDMGYWQPNIIIYGLINTLRLFGFSIIIGLVIGSALAVMRIVRIKSLNILSTGYINAVRNIPPLVFLFIFYFFISEQIFPKIGLTPEFISGNFILTFLFGDSLEGVNLLSGSLCLGLFEAVFFAEIFRGAILSIEKGQRDAGRALRFSWWQTMRLIILPQAIKKSYPSLAGQSIIALKNTSIASLISVKDIVFSGIEVISSTHRIFETWIIVAVIYFILCYGLHRIFSHFEAKQTIK